MADRGPSHRRDAPVVLARGRVSSGAAGATARARARRVPIGISWLQAVRLTAADYVALTKPRVISLLLVTTVATMFVADRSPRFSTILLTVIGGYLAAGGAGAINHYIERDIDAHMTRTSRRPLPSGRIEPRSALW